MRGIIPYCLSDIEQKNKKINSTLYNKIQNKETEKKKKKTTEPEIGKPRYFTERQKMKKKSLSHDYKEAYGGV